MSRTKVGRSSNTINVIDKYLRKKERKKESHTCVFVCSSKAAPRTHHGQHTTHSTQHTARSTRHASHSTQHAAHNDGRTRINISLSYSRRTGGLIRGSWYEGRVQTLPHFEPSAATEAAPPSPPPDRLRHRHVSIRRH